MSVSVSALRTHIDYTAWATLQLIDDAGQLTPDELHRDFQTADGGVLGTLVHIYAADRVWLWRLQGCVGESPGFVSDSDRSLPVLQRDWPALLERWKAWIAGLTEEQAVEIVDYTDLKGRSWSQPLWQLVLHVVNHGTHHRGQVAGFLRAMGRTPPPLDLVFYYRSLAARAGA